MSPLSHVDLTLSHAFWMPEYTLPGSCCATCAPILLWGADRTIPRQNRRMLHHVRTALAPIVGKVLGFGVDEDMGHRPHEGYKLWGAETVFSGGASTFGGSIAGEGRGPRDWRNSTGNEYIVFLHASACSSSRTLTCTRALKDTGTSAHSQSKNVANHCD